MPAIDKPLFRPEAVRPHLVTFAPPPDAVAARPKLAAWADKLRSGTLDAVKETELLPGYFRVFEAVLGYVGRPADSYTLRREALVKVDGKFADAGLGRFAADAAGFVAVLEGKGPRDPLDRPFAGRKRSAVEHSLNYAVQLKIDWYLVTNLKEIRLFHKGTTRTRSSGSTWPGWRSVLDVKQLNEEHARNVLSLRTSARELLSLERRVSDLLNAAYGLTPADVALMWSTAPPRMPIPAPTGG